MPLETVHRRGAQVAVLLMSPLVVFAAIDVAKGSAVWWPLLLFAVSSLLAAFGAVDAVRVYMTRGWPKVEADVVDQEERGTFTFDSHVTEYSQRLLYAYRNQWFESPLKWGQYPPTQVVLRVNPAEPTEVFCVEQLGWFWVVCLLSAFVLPPVFLLGLVFDWGPTTALLVIYICLGGTAWLAKRLRPTDRADSFSVEVRPNSRLHLKSRRSRAASWRG